MKKIAGLFYIVVLVCLTACSGENKGFYIGKSTSYKPFLGVRYDWQKERLPEQTLELEMGEYHFTKPVVLQVVYCQDKDKTYKPAGTLVTISGKNVLNDLVTITPSDETVRLRFRFNKQGVKDVQSATYKLSLKILDPGDLDQINGQQAKAGQVIDTSVLWRVKYEEVMNPLLKGIIWFLIVFASCVIIWFVILRRLIFPVFDYGTLVVNYCEGGERKDSDMLTIRKARLAICSNAPRYQSRFNEILCGRIAYLVSPFWEREVELRPLGAEGIGVQEKMSADEMPLYRIPPRTITDINGPKNPFEIKRAKSDKSVKLSIG